MGLESTSTEISEKNVDDKNNAMVQPLTSASLSITASKRKSKNRKRQNFLQVKEELQTDKIHPSDSVPSLGSSSKSYSSVIKKNLEHSEFQHSATSCIESSAVNQNNQSMLDNDRNEVTIEAIPFSSNSWVRKTAKRKKQRNRITIPDENLVME